MITTTVREKRPSADEDIGPQGVSKLVKGGGGGGGGGWGKKREKGAPNGWTSHHCMEMTGSSVRNYTSCSPMKYTQERKGVTGSPPATGNWRTR